MLYRYWTRNNGLQKFFSKAQETIPRNRFASLAWQAGTTTLFVVQAGGIDFLESIPELHKRLQIQAQEPQNP
jgi:hypothetical protein